MFSCPAKGSIIMKNVLFVLRVVSSEVVAVLALSALDNIHPMAPTYTKETHSLFRYQCRLPLGKKKKKALCALICEWVGFLTWCVLNPGPLDSARRWKGERREEGASLYSLTSFLDLVYTSSSRRLPRTPVRWRPGINAALGGGVACSLSLVLYRGEENKANVASVLLYI